MTETNNTSQAAVKSSIILAPLIAASLLLLPIYVGGLITANGLTLKQALSVVSLEMWGMAVSLIPAIFAMRRYSWRNVTYGAIGIMILAFLIPVIMTLSYTSLAAIRFIGGIGAGTAMAVIMATIGRANNPDKAFSFWILSQVVFKVLGIYIVSRLLAKFGMNGFFVPLLILCVFAIFLIKDLPGKVVHVAGDTKIKWSPKPILALMGVFIFYVAISAIWANFQSIGNGASFDPSAIATILSITSLASLAGASVATILAGRIKRMNLLIFGVALIALSTAALSTVTTLTMYTLIGLGFAFAWFFLVPFIMASVNSNDKTGQIMVYTNSAIAIGLAVGPAIAAMLISETNFTPLVFAGAGAFILALLALIPSNRANR